MNMPLYVRLKNMGLVAGYEEYKRMDEEEAQAMLEAQEVLIAEIKAIQAEEDKKKSKANENLRHVEEMAARLSNRR